MKNMFNVTTILPHSLLQTNPCIRHNFSTQVFRKRAAGGQKMEARKCSAAQGPHSEVVPRAFWRLVLKSCDECKGSFARGCEAKWWSHWTCSSLGTIFQPMRINSVPGVKCFCNKKMCYMHNQWYDISCATLYVTFGVFAVVSPKVLFVSIVTLHHLVTGTQRSTAMQCPITLTDP